MSLRTRLAGFLLRGQSLHPKDPLLAELFGGAETTSGAVVNSRTALGASAVAACVRNIAETMGTMPCELRRVERDSDGRIRRIEAVEHPLYWVLRERPNDWQTAAEFWEMATRHVQLRGDHFSTVTRNRAGQVTDLHPEHPDAVTPYWREDGRPAYRILDRKGRERILLPGEVFHIRGPMGPDGLRGMNPIAVHRNTVGMALAGQAFGANVFKEDGRPLGVLKTQETLSDSVIKRLKKGWLGSGPDSKRHKIAVLEEGLEFQQVSLSAEDAQYIQTRGFTDLEIARLFRVPPVKIGIMEKATYRNVEEQQRAWVADTLLGMARRIEAAVGRDLLIPAGRRRFRASFNFVELLRGDAKTQAEVLAKLIQWGVYSPNDAREYLGENPREGGDDYLTPANMNVGDEDDEDSGSSSTDEDPLNEGQEDDD